MSRHICYINCSVVLHKSKKTSLKFSYSTVVVKNTKERSYSQRKTKLSLLKNVADSL